MTDNAQQNQLTIHLMVDIETLGLKPGAGIWQIGAVEVTRDNPNHGYSDTVSPDVYMGMEGYAPEAHTIIWQRSHNTNNYLKALTQASSCPPSTFISDFYNWLIMQYGGVRRNVQFWSKGDFDRQHLEYAFALHKLAIPWKYYQWNDLRTLCNFFNDPVPKFAGAHDAWTDAVEQAKHLYKLMQRAGV